MDKICAALTAGFRFQLDAFSGAEVVQLCSGKQELGLFQPQLDDRGGQQGFAGFGQVCQAGVERKDRQPAANIQFAALVGVEQAAKNVLRR